MAKVNHFKGKDPIKWVAGIVTFKSVHMGEIYPGVSLRLQAHANNVEKIFSIHPGADPKKIQLSLDGAKSLRLTAEGELGVNAGAGTMRFTKPVAYQQSNGSKTPVNVAYTVEGSSYGFQLAAYDTTKELIIDPLIRAVFKGAPETYTLPTCSAADSQGNIYVAGISAGQFAVFKFDGRLENTLASALFGSSSIRSGHSLVDDIAVDRQDAVYIVGGAKNGGAFPVTGGAFDPSIGSRYSYQSDRFVIKYDADLSEIIAATFIGGDKDDLAYGLTIAQDDTVYVVGAPTSPVYEFNDQVPFPTSADAYNTALGTHWKTKVFVVIHLDSELQTLQATTLLGGDGIDQVSDMAIDGDGRGYLCGGTESTHFPVTADFPKIKLPFQTKITCLGCKN